MTREEIIARIRQHALDLQELTDEYSEAANVADLLPSGVLIAMLEMTIKHDQIHKTFADALKHA